MKDLLFGRHLDHIECRKGSFEKIDRVQICRHRKGFAGCVSARVSARDALQVCSYGGRLGRVK